MAKSLNDLAYKFFSERVSNPFGKTLNELRYQYYKERLAS